MDENEEYSPSEAEEDQYKTYDARKGPTGGGQSVSDDEEEDTQAQEGGAREEEQGEYEAAPPDDEEDTMEDEMGDDEEGAAAGGDDYDEDMESEAAGAAAPAEAEGDAEMGGALEEDVEEVAGDDDGGKGPWGDDEDEMGGGEDFDEIDGEDPGGLGKRLSQIRDPFPYTDEKILEHLLEASKQAYARIARIEDIRSFIKEYEEVRDQEGRPKDEKQPPEIRKAREDLIKELEKFDAIVRRIDRLCSLTNVYSPEDYLPPLQRQPIADTLGKRLSELMDQLELEKMEKHDTGCCAYCAREEGLPKMVVCGTTDHVPMVVFCDPGGRKLGKPQDCNPGTCLKRGPGGVGSGGGAGSFSGRKYRECDRFHGPEDIAGVAGANAILDQVNYMSDEIKKLRLENMKLSYRLNSINVFQEVDDSIARAAMSRGAGGAGPLSPSAPCARPANFRQPGMSATMGAGMGTGNGMGSSTGPGVGGCAPFGFGGRQGSNPVIASSAMMPDSAMTRGSQYSGPAISVAPPQSCGMASCHTSRGGGNTGGLGGGGYGAPLPMLRLRGSGVDLETKSNFSLSTNTKGLRTRSCSYASTSSNIPCLRLRGAGPAGGCGINRSSARPRSPLRPACHPSPPPPRACGLTPDPCPPIASMRSSMPTPGHRTWPPQKPLHKSIVFGSGPWLSQPMGARPGSGLGGMACPNCSPSGLPFSQEPPPPKEPSGCACEYKDPMTSPLRPSQDLKQRRWYGKSCTCPPATFGSSEYCDCDCNRGMGPKSDSRPTGWMGPNADAQCVPECGNTGGSQPLDRDGCSQSRPPQHTCCEPPQPFDPFNTCKGPDPQGPDMVSQMERQLQDMECDVARMKRELSIMQRFNEELENESKSAKCPCPETSTCKPGDDDDEDEGKGKKNKNNKVGNKKNNQGGDQASQKNTKGGDQASQKNTKGGDQASQKNIKGGDQASQKTSNASGRPNTTRSNVQPAQSQNSNRGALDDKVGSEELG